MNDEVHRTHCCAGIHGCKYMDDDCPVQMKRIPRSTSARTAKKSGGNWRSDFPRCRPTNWTRFCVWRV